MSVPGLALTLALSATAAGVPDLSFEAPANAVAAVRWNAFARHLALSGRGESFRTFALLGLAQLRAVKKATPAEASATVVAASAALLEELFPERRGDIRRRKRADPQAPSAAAERVGDDAAREVLAAARARERPGPPLEPPPAGPGLWVSAAGRRPVGAAIPAIAPWVLATPDELRPPPPPRPGSAAFAAALDAVRAAVHDRTPAQQAAAVYWAGGSTGEQTPGQWNGLASALLARRGLGENDAARALALLDVAMHDAAIACFEAKYHYRLARPSQIDPSLRLAVTLPNFPAYPSAHACFSGAAAGILAAILPDEKATVDRWADEATQCRVWAGLHYPFDGKAGLALGRSVAARVLAHADEL